jgi:lipoate---protein ligase
MGVWSRNYPPQTSFVYEMEERNTVRARVGMKFISLTLESLPESVALDEALLLEAEAVGGEILRLWEWSSPAVVLGSGCRLVEDVDEVACHRDGVPILRRSSGGGTVLLGAGCLCFTLVLSYQRATALGEIRPSYGYILERIRTALADLAPDMRCAGTSDLASGGRKFSGNAQQRKRKYLLHHGTLLYAFDVSRVSRYVRSPARQPDYRGGREHADFLMNLPTNAAELKQRLRAAWGADMELHAWPHDMVKQLVDEKYSRPEWVRRR